MRLGLWGYGHLGKAIAEGLTVTGTIRTEELLVCTRSENNLHAAREKGYRTTKAPGRFWHESDVVFAALPEQAFVEIAPSLPVREGVTPVSLMAGVSIERIYGLLGRDIQVMRAMPSLAVALGDGIVGLTAGAPL